jgi:hypothetical protein
MGASLRYPRLSNPQLGAPCLLSGYLVIVFDETLSTARPSTTEDAPWSAPSGGPGWGTPPTTIPASARIPMLAKRVVVTDSPP